MIHEKKKQLQISLSLHRALPRQQSLAVGGGGRRLHRGDERRPVRPRRDGRRHFGQLLAAQLRGRRGREREALRLRMRGTDQQRRRRVGLRQVAHRRPARREALVGALPAAAAARQHFRGGVDGGRGGGIGAAPKGDERTDGLLGDSRTKKRILQSQGVQQNGANFRYSA